MKKIVIVTALVCVCFGLEAQSKSDSLWGVWQNASLADTVRAEALYGFINSSNSLETPERAMTLANELIEFSESKKTFGYLAKAIDVKGVVYTNKEMYDSARLAINKAFELRKAHNLKGQFWLSWSRIGRLYRVQKDTLNAGQNYRKAMKDCLNRHNTEGQSQVFDELYFLYRDIDAPKAIDIAEWWVALNKKAALPKLVAQGQDRLSRLYFDIDELNKSISMRKASLAYYISVNDHLEIGYCYDWIAWVYYGLGNKENGITYDKRALKKYVLVKDEFHVLFILNRLAFAYAQQQEFDSAIAYANKTSVIINEQQDDGALIELNNRLAGIYRTKGDIQRAIQYAQDALDLIKAKNDTVEMLGQLSYLGYMYIEANQAEKGINHYLKANALAEELGDDEAIYTSRLGISRAYSKINDVVNQMRYANMALVEAKKNNNKQRTIEILAYISVSYYEKGFFAKAIETRLIHEKICIETGDSANLISCYQGLGTYYEEGYADYETALKYYKKSTVLSTLSADKNSIGMSLINEGTIHFYTGNYQSALDMFYEAEQVIGTIQKARDTYELKSYLYQRLGSVYAQLTDYDKAIEYFKISLDQYNLLNSQKDKKAEVLAELGFVYTRLNQLEQGIKSCEEGYAIGVKYFSYSAQKMNCECLYEIYQEIPDNDKALFYLQRLVVINDTIETRVSVKKLQQLEFAKQMQQDSLAQVENARLVKLAHDEEIANEKRKETYLTIGGLAILLLAGGIFSRLQYVRKSKALLQKEKDRSEELLLNILPEDVAEELKATGTSEARDYDDVTVLFTDFQGFTSTAEQLSAKELVEELNYCFKAFDGLMVKHGLEKIKTIGDAYMAAGGLQIPRESEPNDVVQAALEMQAFMIERQELRERENLPSFQMRVGIHTGPVVAGIVGVKKFQYDIWGDTVNTASRMESSGEVGKVNISQATYELLKDDARFAFESRGKIEAKGKGEMEMWFVSLKK